MKIQLPGSKINPVRIVDTKGLKEFLTSRNPYIKFAQIPSDVFQNASEKGVKSIVIGAGKNLEILGGKAYSPLVQLPLINLDFILNGGILNALGTRIKGNVTAKNAGVGLFASILGDAKTSGEGCFIKVEKGIKGSVNAVNGIIKADEAGSYIDASQGALVMIKKSVNASATATENAEILVDGNIFGDITAAGEDSLVRAKNAIHNAHTYQGGGIEIAENVLGNVHGDKISVKGEVYNLPWENDFMNRKRLEFLRTLGQK